MTTARAAYFKALGIDVWVRRRPRAEGAQRRGTGVAVPQDAEPAVSRRRPPRTLTRPTPPPASAMRQPVPDQPASEESFRVRCFRYGRVFAALAEDAWPVRHFLLDVAWALNDFVAAERKDLVFDWPQPGAVPDGGGKAFGAFFRHQTRTRTGSRVLLAGARVAALLGHPPPNESCVLDGGLYVCPETMDNQAKRDLWRLIQDLSRES